MFVDGVSRYLAANPAPPTPPAPPRAPPLLNVNNGSASTTANVLNEDVPDYGFTDFRPERFLQELLEAPLSGIQETMERMMVENKQLREKIEALDKERQRLQSIAPIPKDADSLCAELQDALAAKTELQKRVDILDAKESVLQGYGIDELNALESELRGSLRKVETRKVILQERQNTLCVICLSQPKSIVLMACSHLCLCESCLNQSGASLTECPVCQKTITGTLKVFS